MQSTIPVIHFLKYQYLMIRRKIIITSWIEFYDLLCKEIIYLNQFYSFSSQQSIQLLFAVLNLFFAGLFCCSCQSFMKSKSAFTFHEGLSAEKQKLWNFMWIMIHEGENK